MQMLSLQPKRLAKGHLARDGAKPAAFPENRQASGTCLSQHLGSALSKSCEIIDRIAPAHSFIVLESCLLTGKSELNALGEIPEESS